MKIARIESKRAMAMVMDHHYSQRKVGSRCSFGLFENGDFVGCCVYSIPASYTLCKGVCGEAFKSYVLELSRLVITTESKNAASFLIGRSLRELGNAIVVSYADCNEHVGHVGYVYQATNWIYTGQGNAEPMWIDPQSGDIVSFTRRHIDNKAKKLGLHWSELQKVPQKGKHRYVAIVGDRRFKRAARSLLNYPVLPYPKGPTVRHQVQGEPKLF